MKFTIHGELTDLNAYINAERTNRYMAAMIKSQETDRVAYEAIAAKLSPPTLYPVKLRFTWYTPNARKDVDNCCFAKKFILDGLVKAGVLAGDGRKHVAGFLGEDFYVDAKNPRVEIEICSSTNSTT